MSILQFALHADIDCDTDSPALIGNRSSSACVLRS
jgi:hypothetical protein